MAWLEISFAEKGCEQSQERDASPLPSGIFLFIISDFWLILRGTGTYQPVGAPDCKEANQSPRLMPFADRAIIGNNAKLSLNLAHAHNFQCVTNYHK